MRNRLLMGIVMLIGLLVSGHYADAAAPTGYEIPGTTYVPRAGGQNDTQMQYLLGAGVKPKSPWDASQLPFLGDLGSIPNYNPGSILFGGRTQDDQIYLQQSCQTYSAPELGGACLDIHNQSGPHTPDATNDGTVGTSLRLDSHNAKAVFFLGGNKVTLDSFGNVSAIGNTTSVATAVARSATSIVVTTDVECGDATYGTYCDLATQDGSTPFQTSTGAASSSVRVTSSSFAAGQTTLTLAYSTLSTISVGTTLTWHVYQPDGVAYGLVFTGTGVEVVPALTTAMQNAIRVGMSAYTNIVNGNYTETDGVTSSPDHYYAYVASITPTTVGATTGSLIGVSSMPYSTATGAQSTFRSVSSPTIMPVVSDVTTYMRAVSTVGNSPAGATTINLNAAIPDSFTRLTVTLSGATIPSGITGRISNSATTGKGVLTLSSALQTAIPASTLGTITGVGADGTATFAVGNLLGDTVSSSFMGYTAPTLAFGSTHEIDGYLASGVTQDQYGTASHLYDNKITYQINSSDTPRANGLSMSWSGNTISAASHALSVNGGGILSNGLILQNLKQGSTILSTDAFVGFYGFSAAKNPYTSSNLGTGYTTDAAQTAMSTLAYYSSGIAGTQSMNLGVIKTQSLTMGTDIAAETCTTNCSIAGRVQWDPSGIDGAIGFTVSSSGNTYLGLYVTPDGIVHMPQGYVAGGAWTTSLDAVTDSITFSAGGISDLGLRLAAVPLASIKAVASASNGDGAYKYCVDCYFHGVVGTLVHYNTALKAWVDADQMALTTTGYTYTTLPTSSITIGISTYCKDCYSKLREDGDTTVGLYVKWDGSRWDDQGGIAVVH